MEHFQKIWNAGSWFDQRILVSKHGWVTQTTHVSNNGLTWRQYTYMDDDVLKKEFSRYALRLAFISQPPYYLKHDINSFKNADSQFIHYQYLTCGKMKQEGPEGPGTLTWEWRFLRVPFFHCFIYNRRHLGGLKLK